MRAPAVVFRGFRPILLCCAVLTVTFLTACGGGSVAPNAPPVSQAAPAAPASVLYAVGPDAPVVNEFAVSGSGGLSPVQGSPMLLSLGSPVSMSTDPSGQFVYAWQQQIEDDDVGVVGENGLSAYRVNRSTGALTEVPGSPLKTTQARVASAMVFAPTGLAFTRETSAIGVYRMDAATGMLAEQPGSPYALKAIPVAVTPNGKWLIAASQADSTIDTFSIDRVSGALTLHASSKLTGHVSANALLATNGSTVFVSVGDPTLDQTFGVDAFAVAGDGGVSLANSTPLEHSSQIALSADGNVLYAVSSFDISAFHVNAADGTLALIGSPVPYDPVGPISAPVVSGNELFVSEFFQVRSFALDPATGSIGGNTIAADTPSSASWLAVVK